MPFSVDTKWFHDRLADRKLSQRELARRIELDPSALSLTFRGRRSMKLTEAAEISRLLGVPLDEVLFRAGVEKNSGGRTLAISGWMDMQGEVHFDNELGEIPHPGGEIPGGVTVVQCRTAGSVIDYMDGWVFFIGSTAEPPSMAHLSRLCIVRMTGGVIYLAQLRRGYRPGRWNLSGPVAQFTDVTLDWSAPVLSIKT